MRVPLRNPELLAPAGNMNTALAAFDAGADAVYCGLKKFNARERTDNFTFEEMGKLIAYARKNGKKVYVTFNTVIRENEVDDAADVLAELDFLRPDALIVQDIGMVRMIREFFPNLAVHASTQMAVNDSSGIAAAREMGIRRVILERQTSIEEIRAIMKQTPLEVEVFVHGALCCSISGICLLSSWIGGASGNRGKCKQSCRKLFTDQNGNKGYYLSTRDLAAFRLIPEFRKLGIASLKIEGRLRRADYVSEVVTAYRTVLDAPEDRIEEACRQAAFILSRTASREPSCGFYTEKSAHTVIRKETLGNVGRPCGTVCGIGRNSFRLRLTDRLHVGDIIRIQSRNSEMTEMVTVTEILVNGKSAVKAFSGQECVIPCRDRVIPENGDVFKTGESFSSMEKRINSLPESVPNAVLELTLDSSGLNVKTSFGTLWHTDTSFEKALKNPLTEEALAGEFTCLMPPGLTTAVRSSKITGSWFVPKSILKNLRREFMNDLNSRFTPEAIRKISLDRAEKAKAFHAAIKPCVQNGEERILKKDSPDEMLLPFFTPESGLEKLREKIRKAYASGVRKFRITNVGNFALLKGLEGIERRIFAPFPVANSFAVLEAQALGADSVLMHIECGKEDLEALLSKSVLPAEQYVYGRPVILASRAQLPVKGDFSDLPGEHYSALYENGLSLVIPGRVFCADPLPGAIRLSDFRFAEKGETGPFSRFNFDRGLL